MCESKLKVELIDLARYGTKARSLLGSPRVIIGESNGQSKYRQGDILDANTIIDYINCYIKENVQKPFDNINKQLYAINRQIDNLKGLIDQLKSKIKEN